MSMVKGTAGFVAVAGQARIVALMSMAMGYGPNFKARLLGQIGYTGDFALIATANPLAVTVLCEWVSVAQGFLNYRIVVVTGAFWEAWELDPVGRTVVRLVDTGHFNERDRVKKGRWVSTLTMSGAKYVVTAQDSALDQIARLVAQSGTARPDVAGSVRAAALRESMTAGAAEFAVAPISRAIGWVSWAVLTILVCALGVGAFLLVGSR